VIFIRTKTEIWYRFIYVLYHRSWWYWRK